MDVNNENIEPVTDLGLALGYSNQSIQSRLNSDSGAGANAGSVQELDMTFVATEPLSELVWSTDKGPSNVTLSPPQSITGGRSAAEKPIDEENFITSNTSFRVKSEVSGKDALTTSPTSDAGIMLACGSSHEYETETGANAEEVKTAAEVSILHKQVDTCSPNNFEVDEIPEIPETGEIFFTTLPGDVDRERVDMMKSDQIIPFVGQNEPLLGDCVSEDSHADDGNQNREMDFLLTSKADLVNESKDSGALVVDQISQGRRPLDKLESTDDNDIQNLKSENAYGAASQKLGSEYLLRDKESFEKVEEMLPVNDSVLDKHSPTNSRIHKHISKGKEKALSDGNLSGRMSKEEDDSHESVESCNSARLFSSGKRWGYEEEFIIGSKRFRKKIQQTPGCTSYIRQDSSFMNWISTMMKGFSKSIQDEALPLPLTVVHPDHARESSDKKLITYNKNQDAGLKNIGFQSIFQSLYCPRAEGHGTRMSSGDHEIGERSEELEAAIIPKKFHGEKMKLREGCLLSVGKFKESTCGNEVGSAIQPEILSAKVAGSQEKGNTNSVENKTACNVEYDKKNSGVSSGSSLGKRKKKSIENVESDPESEAKTTDKFVHRSDLLGSLWITRFTPKISRPLMSDRYSVGAGFDCSNDKKNVGVKEQSVQDIVVSGNDLQDCAVDNAGSLAFNRNEGQSDEKSICKLNPLFPAPKFGGSEDMASVFARRLDALKHITPSGITGNADDKIMTCFFCGIRGHHLRECSEIKDNELQDLPRIFESYNGAEYLPSFCIRCFQCSHWAVACPNATSVGQPQLGCNVSYYCSPSETKLNAEGNMKLLIGKENQFQASVDHQLCDEDDSGVDTDLNLSWTSKVASKKMRHSSNSAKRYSASTSGQNKFKEKQVMPLSQFVNMPVSDVPKGIFDSVKRLRLSRTDVLKWMDSHTSLSNLEGFFLRLRLGKCKTGLGGTGYYVSCITGTGSQRESCAGNAKNSISVIVGGIRFLVQTQYVSNHDFLEDELRAWWSATSKSNVKIPSEEDLREKVKMKKMLGL